MSEYARSLLVVVVVLIAISVALGIVGAIATVLEARRPAAAKLPTRWIITGQSRSRGRIRPPRGGARVGSRRPPMRDFRYRGESGDG